MLISTDLGSRYFEAIRAMEKSPALRTNISHYAIIQNRSVLWCSDYMFSIEQQKNLFLNEIKKLRQALDALKIKNTLQELERFENQLTLNELEQCLEAPNCEANLIELLAQRWERIRDSSMCYTQKPFNIINQLCLKLATALSSPVTTPSEIESLKPNTGPYFLLMPSLENGVDVYGGNIHNLQLHEFILSDKERVFIPLISCLHQASISDAGRLRHVVEIDEQYPELTSSEIERVSKHSNQAAQLYQSILAFNKQRLLGNDIGAKLSQLAAALRGGGSHGSGSGNELNAGSEANLGILIFSNYWNGLSELQRAAIFAETPTLRNILGRLFRPEDVNYKETRFCVELIANALDPIIEEFNKKPSIQKLQKKVDYQEKILGSALKKPQNLVIIPNSHPPKNILHRIFKLSTVEQKKIFKYDDFENSLMYALAHEPEELSKFELDEKSKQQAVLAKIKPNNDSCLIIASKRGSISAIKLLLSWGSDIEQRDKIGCNALHWAARNGNADAVKCLLENGSQLEALTHRKNTPLNLAVIFGKRAIVDLLLKSSNLNARNMDGQNALDIAIKDRPELVDPILMQLAALPADKQAECLLNVPNGPYPNVLFYAAAHKPYLFNALITTTLEQPHITPDDAIFTTPNQIGLTPLILAAKLGINESINKLIGLGVDIKLHDTHGNDSLSWAAARGHVDTVSYLLENGASIEARGVWGNTALNWAVCYGHKATTELLLKKNADVNVRNNKGMNALDIAIKNHPELVDPILVKMAALPIHKQQECLLNVPGGPYPNIFFYAAIANTNFLKSLLRTFNNNALDSKMQPIFEHIHQIGLHYQTMIEKSFRNSNYKTAVSVAKTLLNTCIDEILKLYQSDDNTDVKMLEFKNSCAKAIETARPVLAKYREWAKVLAAFLLAVVALPVSLIYATTGFFSTKTKSEQLLDNLQSDINNLE